MRKFSTGATRNSDDESLDYEGFLSPLVLQRYAEHMHKARYLDDGTLRPSDNWQDGIPMDSYMQSLLRHVMDVWLHHRRRGFATKEDMETALCAVMFNAMGYLHEIMLARLLTIESQKERGTYVTGSN